MHIQYTSLDRLDMTAEEGHSEIETDSIKTCETTDCFYVSEGERGWPNKLA